jgi:hypothetical protein
MRSDDVMSSLCHTPIDHTFARESHERGENLSSCGSWQRWTCRAIWTCPSTMTTVTVSLPLQAFRWLQRELERRLRLM